MLSPGRPQDGRPRQLPEALRPPPGPQLCSPRSGREGGLCARRRRRRCPASVKILAPSVKATWQPSLEARRPLNAGESPSPPRVSPRSVGGCLRPNPARPLVARESAFVLHSGGRLSPRGSEWRPRDAATGGGGGGSEAAPRGCDPALVSPGRHSSDRLFPFGPGFPSPLLTPWRCEAGARGGEMAGTATRSSRMEK